MLDSFEEKFWLGLGGVGGLRGRSPVSRGRRLRSPDWVQCCFAFDTRDKATRLLSPRDLMWSVVVVSHRGYTSQLQLVTYADGGATSEIIRSPER